MIGINKEVKQKVKAFLFQEIKLKKEKPLTPQQQLELGQSATFYSYEDKGIWRH